MFQRGIFFMQQEPLTYRTRPWTNEWMYSLVIDRFHDGKDRVAVSNNRKGFGTVDELRQVCGGTIEGIRKQLPYIQKLGCTCILLTPFLENNSGYYHGYAIQDFLKVDERFGTLAELQHLIQEAHALDIRVVMDVVLNHTGNNWSYKKEHPTYAKGRSFAFSHWHRDDKPQPIALRNEKLYSKKGHIVNWDAYPESWEGDVFELKDLTWTEDKKGRLVLDAMVDVYLYWVKELGIDGFRLDALKHIRPSLAQKFCERIKAAVAQMGYTHFLLIGEVVGDLDLITSYQGLDAYYNFPFYFGWNQKVSDGLVFDAFHLENNSTLIPLNFLDNHDQIGLSPKRRIGKVLSDEGIIANLFLLGLMPGISCLYYGTEQGLMGEGEMDHDIRECLFDRGSNGDVLDQCSNLYLKISEVISLAKKIKARTHRIEQQTLNSVSQVYQCFDAQGVGIYSITITSVETKKDVEYIEGKLVYALSGFWDKTGECSICLKVVKG